MEVNDRIIGISPDLANVFPELVESQMSREDDNSVQVGMPFYEFSVGFINDICDIGFGETLSERCDGRRCHNDITDPPEPDQKDLLNPGWINLSFLSRAQWSPHR